MKQLEKTTMKKIERSGALERPQVKEIEVSGALERPQVKEIEGSEALERQQVKEIEGSFRAGPSVQSAAKRTDQSNLAARLLCLRVRKDSNAHFTSARRLLDGPLAWITSLSHTTTQWAPSLETYTKVCKWCASKATTKKSDESDSSSSTVLNDS